MKIFLDPVFAPQEIPDLVHFYPGEDWYNQQQMLRPLSGINKHKKYEGTFTKADMIRMLFWEYKPAKLITISLTGILISIILSHVWTTEWISPFFWVFFVAFAIATAYNNDNFITVVEYIIQDGRNKWVINKYLKKHLAYNEFIVKYHRFMYRKHGRAIDILLAFMMGVVWLSVLILFLLLFMSGLYW